MKKAREVITLNGWVNGRGWSFGQCYGDSIFETASVDYIDWDWWETDADNPPSEETDTQIVVDYYAEGADIDEDKPLASYSKWASEIWKERHQEEA